VHPFLGEGKGILFVQLFLAKWSGQKFVSHGIDLRPFKNGIKIERKLEGNLEEITKTNYLSFCVVS
jgi:hypothetical protein